MTFDIGIGLLLGVLLNDVSGISYGWCLCLGILACLLPDADFVLPSILTRRVHWNHRNELTSIHYPLLLIPATVIVALFFNPWVALIFFLGLLSHFLHDSIGIGWGVKWLYPFKSNTYVFLYKIFTDISKGLPRQNLYSWTHEEQKELRRKYTDPEWFRKVYLRPTTWGLVEHAVLVIGIIVAVWHP